MDETENTRGKPPANHKLAAAAAKALRSAFPDASGGQIDAAAAEIEKIFEAAWRERAASVFAE